MPEIPFTCGRKGKLRKESLFSKIPGYVWTRLKVSLQSLCSLYEQHLRPELLLYLNMKLRLFLLSFVLHYLKLAANNSLV